mmetsp:Transcript_124880/g.266509  ORF Transcript_124880/g.266509 Transcript_124880/m.266509 type:complete len:244 (+) Transcript_124880:461-1192(+)
MGQREGPDAEVGGCVRDCTQNELDGLDDLVDEHLTKLELLSVPVVAMTTGSLGVRKKLTCSRILLLPVVLVEQDERLREEHQRHRANGVLHKCLSELHRAVPEGEKVLLSHGHADQGIDDARRGVYGMHPLVEDHEVHPSEEAKHEDHHGQALKNEVHQALLVEGVAPSQEHPDNHLQHTKQHRELHLQRVHEKELIGGILPGPIQPEGVGARAARVRNVVRGRKVAIAIFVLEARREELETY